MSVTDIGVAPLLVTAVRVASDPNNELKVMSILTTDCSGNARTGGSTLQPNECAHFIVAWTPSGDHAAAGAIEVDSNDPVTPAVTLPVTGNAVAPQISVTPTTLAFGSTTIGVPQQIQVSVSNVGTAPLIIGTVKIASDPNNELSLDDVLTTDCMNQSRTGGTTLQPGECARFTTIWSPTAVHAASGAVEIDSNDPANPAVTLPVTGAAVTPLLQVCVLSSTGAVVPSQCSDLSASPRVIPTVAFGTVPPDTNAALGVQLTNQGTAPLTFSPAPALGAGSAAAFSLTGSVGGNTLAPGASATLTVGADASTAGSVSGTLSLVSNDLRAPSLAVPITMTVPGWQLCANSTSVAFGAVAIGSTSTKQATFTNCGQAALTIDSFTTAAIAPTSSQFTYTGLPANGASIAVGGVITVSISYKPTAVQNDAATINYSAAYGGATLTGAVSVTGNGTLAGCGTAGRPNPVPSIAASYSTNAGNTYTAFNPASTSVLPLDYIKLDASGSTVSQGTASYTWTLTSQPSAGTPVTLSSTTATTVTFQPLVSGTYSVSLVVKDSTGCVSTSAATVNITVKAVGAIHIELTWAEDCGDLDLHYVAPGGSICDGNDIFYADLPGGPPPIGYGGPGFRIGLRRWENLQRQRVQSERSLPRWNHCGRRLARHR